MAKTSFGSKTDSTDNKKLTKLDDIFIPGDETLNISELEEAFRGKNIDAKKLREEGWKRKSNG